MSSGLGGLSDDADLRVRDAARAEAAKGGAYLVRTGRPVWTALAPLIFMVVITGWAMVGNVQQLWSQGKVFLPGLSVLILGLQFWMLVESFLVIRKGGILPDLEDELPENVFPVPVDVDGSKL